MSGPQGYSPPQGLEKGKSYCENTKKPATSFPSYDPFFLYLAHNSFPNPAEQS